MVRVALALANMTSDKVEDHVARLLRKEDVGKVASKPKLAVAMEHEQALQTGFDIAMTLGGVDKLLQPLGQMFVRSGLLLTGKEKQGRERTGYTLKEICSKYLADGSALIGQQITFEGWAEEQESTEGAEKPEPTMAQSSPSKAVATLSDLQDPVWIAQQAGFSVGTLVVQKSVVASTEGWYTIFSWRRSSAASGGQLQWPACQGFYLPECSAD